MTRFWRWLLPAFVLLCGAAHAAENVQLPSLDQSLTATGQPTSLLGVLYKPDGAGPFPAIVMLHGCGGLFNAKTGRPDARSVWWAEYFQQHGYVALMIDSFKSRNASVMCPHGAPTILPDRERPLDTYGALRYLQQQPFVMADRIGLIGWSHGGGTLLYSIDAQSPARPADLQHDFRAAVAFYPGWCNARAHGWRWHTQIPLLVLLGESDNWVHAPPCQSFIEGSRANGTQADVVVYPDTYHDFDWPRLVEHTIANFSGRGPDHIVAPNPAAAADAQARVLAFFDHNLKN
jgi:dienelactone hydrolase